MSSTITAANNAYKMAKITHKKLIQLKYHDAFSVCELMAVEDLSLTEKNTGATYVRNLFNTETEK